MNKIIQYRMLNDAPEPSFSDITVTDEIYNELKQRYLESAIKLLTMPTIENFNAHDVLKYAYQYVSEKIKD